MEYIEISAYNQTIKISKIGGALLEYKYNDDLITMSTLDEYYGSNGKIMSPWPNRIEDGQYNFNNKDFQLEITEPNNNNSNHGLTSELVWEVIEQDYNKLKLQVTLENAKGYPWKLKQILTYRIMETGLYVKFVVQNLSDEQAPFGLGWHPYFDTKGNADNCKLLLDAKTHIIVNDRLLPIDYEDVKSPKKWTSLSTIGDTILDDAFIDLERGFNGKTNVLLTRCDGKVIEIWADKQFNAWQIFTGDTSPKINRKFIAIEPLTCLANAYNTKEFLTTLDKGQEKIYKFGILPH